MLNHGMMSIAGNNFFRCLIKRLGIDSSLKSFTGCEVGEVKIRDDDVDGTELSLLHLKDKVGMDFEFYPASKGVVFWDSATAFRTLEMVLQGSEVWEGKVNMAIVPIGENPKTLKFPHKNERYPDFNRVLENLGLMLEYLVSDGCGSEYLENPYVKDLIANGYRVIGPDGLHYAVVLDKNGKAVSKIETKDVVYARRTWWRNFLAKLKF